MQQFIRIVAIKKLIFIIKKFDITISLWIVTFYLPEGFHVLSDIQSLIKVIKIFSNFSIKEKIEHVIDQYQNVTIFMNIEESKTNEPQKLVFSLSSRLDLENLNKHVTLQNLSDYYT